MIIRPPTINDASALAHIHIETWRNQYVGIIPQDVLDSLDEITSRDRWRDNITTGMAPDSFILVAEIEREVIGYVTGGPIREPLEGFSAELYAIYILPTAQKKNTGRLLVRTFVQELKRRNFHDMIVWVLEANPARGFYERLGGKLIGQKTIEGGRAAGLSEVAYGWDDLPELMIN